MRGLSGEDIRARISSADDNVMHRLDNLNKSFEEAKSRCDNVGTVSHGSIINRIKGNTRVIESLRRVITNLEATNNTLESIVSRPQEHSPERYSSLQALQAATNPSLRLSPDVARENTLLGRVRSEPKSSVRTIYDTCSSIMYTIETHIGNPAGIAPRLKIWGIGIFDGPFPIDIIMDNNRERYGTLREFLLYGFVNIAVTEGKFPRGLPSLGREC
jgi:hypothetical protein